MHIMMILPPAPPPPSPHLCNVYKHACMRMNCVILFTSVTQQ